MEVLLANNKGIALIDDEDFNIINKYKWHIKSGGYANTTFKNSDGKLTRITMHKLIMGEVSNNLEIDHKNRNKLDNRRSNLRFCTRSENQKNKKPTGRSKYLGVSIHKTKRKYITKKGLKKEYTYTSIIAHIKANGKYLHLGTFNTELEAALAYNKAAVKYHGEFANLNKI